MVDKELFIPLTRSESPKLNAPVFSTKDTQITRCNRRTKYVHRVEQTLETTLQGEISLTTMFLNAFIHGNGNSNTIQNKT